MRATGYNRRIFLKKGGGILSAITGFGVLLAACNGSGTKPDGTTADSATNNEPAAQPTGSDPCDSAALTEQDVKNRKALGYVEQTPIPEKNCEGCKLFIPANDTKKCGTCSLFKGPIAPEGYCTYWADKSA